MNKSKSSDQAEEEKFAERVEKPSHRNVEMGSTIIQMKQVTKHFPGVLANDHVDIEFKAGEIHALLGENGAGKTTLMNVLYGLWQPEEGEIIVRGKKVKLSSPKDAIDLGIGMVHQHFMLVSVFDVVDSVILGLHSQGLVLNRGEAKKKIEELSKRFNLKVDFGAKIWQLSMGEQQRVEILKQLFRGIDILILDEPTAVLTPQEVDELFNTIQRMTQEGLTVIFITHKLKEVMKVSQTVTVLRGGKVVETLNTRDTDEHKLARLMVGREVLFSYNRPEVKTGDVVLEVKDAEALNDRGLPALKKVSLQVRQGEILGIAGVSGNGQKELVEVISGLRRATGGKILIGGHDLTNAAPRKAIDQGLSYIPEDRQGVGLLMRFPLTENVILKAPSEPPLADGWFLKRLGLSSKRFNLFLNRSEIAKKTDKLISDYDIRTPGRDIITKTLSGGNLQKVILARELSQSPKLIIADQPTRGLDVGATEYVRLKLIESRSNKGAVMLISEDLDEILTVSDRIAVMYEGEIVGTTTPDVDLKDLGMMMAGAHRMAQEE
ncbi:MAG TPA: ABC transporter ATP-binding protein [Candidatus Bathyarchaeia archaeon]|nr:ABC transporter ATP-binding protein [Candidatus Bathyarchaeia archaeon]